MENLREIAHRPRVKPVLRVLEVMLAVIVGSLAFSLAAQSTGPIGPLTVTVRLTPAIDGRTTLAFPPFGRVIADTHAGPLSATASLDEIDIVQVQQLAGAPELAESVVAEWADQMRAAVTKASLTGLLAALAAASAVAWIMTRSWRTTTVAFMLVIALPGGALALSTYTFDETAFREPTFEGALVYAPGAFGLVQQKLTDIRSVQAQAGALAADLAAYYGSSQTIAPGGSLPGTFRVLHVSDLHLDPLGMQLAIDLARAYDVALVIDTGDISYFGTEQEGLLAAAQMSDRPYVFVPGNHDSAPVLSNIAGNENVTVLNGETTTTATGLEILGVGDPFGTDDEYEPDNAAAERVGLEAARATRGMRFDIVAVHNRASGMPFAGRATVVLSGHTHTPALDVIDGTVFLNAGTTGGVHFSDLTDDPHIPNSAAILYFSVADPQRLVAVDQVEVYGKTRQSSIRRTIIDEAFVRDE